MRVRFNRLLPVLAASAGCIAASPPVFAALTLAQDGATRYTIYHAPQAPASVRLAAQELRRYFARSTGALLPIAQYDPPRGPCICLGDSVPARSAGLIDKQTDPQARRSESDGYRIASRGANIYIVGADTRDGAVTAQGGVSTGTLNGVYTFLEDYLGVRWLLPGERGEHVPRHARLELPDLERRDTPQFASRTLAHVGEDTPEVQEWLRRLKQGGPLKYWHYHNWTNLVPASLYSTHPEWFALIDGRRQPPRGDRYKLETTNAGLRAYVAARVIAGLRKSPRDYAFSISPSDSEDWSQSAESKALHELDPRGKLSVTPLILDFYNDVAKRVGAVLPDRMVCGYIYAQYAFPPAAGIDRVEPNLCLVIAPHFSYGYGLANAQARRELTSLLSAWTQHSTNTGYYDLPTVFTVNTFGAPNPPGTDILKFLYPLLADSGPREIYMYGARSWGASALSNYLLAKLNWSPRADVDALQREFLDAAYGSAAGPVTAAYARLDDAVARFRAATPGYLDRISPKVLQEVYAPLQKEWDALATLAGSSNDSPPQRRRLEMLQQDLRAFADYRARPGTQLELALQKTKAVLGR